MSYNVCIEIQGKQTNTKAVAAKELDGPGLKLNHMHTHSLAAAKLSLTREVCQFLEAIFDGAPTALQSLTFSRGSQQPIHVDYPYVNAQSRLPYLAASWIPLEDVHPDSGPLAYYPGGHKPEVSGFFDWGGGSITKQKDSPRNSMQFAQFLTERMQAAMINPVTYCPRKGDVLIWHANLPHGGTRINDSAHTRRSLVTHYTASQFYPEPRLPKGAAQRRLRSV
ncbi:MAG: phytanoyl-CoA dioxygenase family protein [Gammaproteobacteria bacterium]